MSQARSTDFYDAAYRSRDERRRRWRDFTAVAKADHVEQLLANRPERLVDIGCGDGAVLDELRRRGIADSMAGFEISAEAVRSARERGLDSVEVFDGSRLPVADDAFDVALLLHVLEHVADPTGLLREAARVAPTVVIEVPLERNVAARRATARALSEGVGHVHKLDLERARELAGSTGLRIGHELLDPLAPGVHVFWADTPVERLTGRAKSVLRRAAFAVSPALATRLFTLHYACVCTRS